MQVVHFLSLFFEYSLLPFVLWGLSYIPKIKRSRDYSEPHNIATYGFEFVLIESLSHLALAIRFLSEGLDVLEQPGIFTFGLLDSHIDFSLSGLSFLVFILLLIIFYLSYTIYGNVDVKNVITFRFSFYTTFFSWILRVLLIGLYSHVFLSLSGAIAFCIISYLLFIALNKIVFDNYITWDVLYREANIYLRNRYYTKARRVCKTILKYVDNKEGKENHQAVNRVSILLASSYYLECNPRNVVEGINYIDNFLQKPWTAHVDRNPFYLHLSALYCIRGKDEYSRSPSSNNHLEYKKKALECIDLLTFDDLRKTGYKDLIQKYDCVSMINHDKYNQ